MKYAIVDLETTGGFANQDKIIDIGVLLVDDYQITDQWQTLINPECDISPFITNLTGISSSDLQDAPKFSDISDNLYQLLQNRVFVAHNVRFDYSFLRSEFSRVNQFLSLPQLCSVKLSRSLYPEHRHHNLDELIKRHHLNISNRHRALPDAMAVYEFFLHAIQQKGLDQFSRQVDCLIKSTPLPKHINIFDMQNIPSSLGVYIYYDSDGHALYVGKGNNLREKITTQLFDPTESIREQIFRSDTKYYELFPCAGELEQNLTKVSLIKKLKPRHNRLLKKMPAFKPYPWPYRGYIVIVEHNNTIDLYTYHLIHNWHLVKSTHIMNDLDGYQNNEHHFYPDDFIEYKIIQKHILSHPYQIHMYS